MLNTNFANRELVDCLKISICMNALASRYNRYQLISRFSIKKVQRKCKHSWIRWLFEQWSRACLGVSRCSKQKWQYLCMSPMIVGPGKSDYSQGVVASNQPHQSFLVMRVSSNAPFIDLCIATSTSALQSIASAAKGLGNRNGLE